MPPEVYLSKLNERYFYNPYKADIYNLGLMILQLLGIDSIKSSVDLYIKEMLQIYNKVLNNCKLFIIREI